LTRVRTISIIPSCGHMLTDAVVKSTRQLKGQEDRSEQIIRSCPEREKRVFRRTVLQCQVSVAAIKLFFYGFKHLVVKRRVIGNFHIVEFIVHCLMATITSVGQRSKITSEGV